MTTPHFPLKIAGLSKTDASRAEVFSPFNEQLLGTVEQADKADIETALSTAHDLYKDCLYTHLRAHETKANLVCRLLLEKKKTKKTKTKNKQ